MKVKELIEFLSTLDQDMDVVTHVYDSEYISDNFWDIDVDDFSVREGYELVPDAEVIKTREDVDRLKKFKVLILDVEDEDCQEKYDCSTLNRFKARGHFWGQPEDLAYHIWKATGEIVPGWEDYVEGWKKEYGAPGSLSDTDWIN